METQRLKLKSLLTIKNGKDHSALEPGIYPVIGSGGVMRYANKFLYSGESVLLPRKGTLSNIQYINDSFWTVDTCYYTEIKKNVVLPYYLYAALRSLDLSGLDSGASIPSMTAKTYYGIKLDIPTLSVQKRIVSILFEYDRLIENNNKRIKILEKLAENLYKEWFVRFRFPGHEQAKFENGIPKGWEAKRLSEGIAKVTAGGDRPDIFSPTKTEGCFIPIFSNGIEDYGLYGYTNLPRITEESVTVSARGTVGFVCLREEPYVPIVRLLSIIPSVEDISAKFLYFALKACNIEGNGTSQQQLTVPMISRQKLLIPEKHLIQKFTDMVDSMYSLRKNLFASNQTLTKQRDLLLPRLMRGELDV